ncbi:MAG: lipolytic protein G-D-S-L family [Prevotella sp.]|nr:lipolytic protein G-D-S-L family [Prevotella sp.]
MKKLITIIAAAVMSMTALAQKEYNIVFIGNSITFGATHQAPQKTNPTKYCVKYLKEQGITAHAKNMGKSGKTSRDFLPGRKGYWGGVKAAAASLAEAYPEAQMVFSIMLGTNDAAIRPKKSCWTDDIFRKSMTTIIDSLETIYPQAIFVLHQDPYFSPNMEKESGSKMDEASLKQVQSYWEVDKALAKERKNVFLGSDEIFAFFEKNHKEMMTPEEGLQGTFYLHPNEKGAAELGKLWAEALAKCLR